MMTLKKLTALLGALVMMLTMAGCSSTTAKGSSSKASTTAKAAKPSPGKVKLKSYEFPEFLSGNKKPDMLSNVVYTSFDPKNVVREITDQPFEGYECTQLIDDTLYVYKQGKHCGLLSRDGEVILEAENYAEITPCAPNMLALSRDKENNLPDDHAYYQLTGEVRVVNASEFDIDALSIASSPKELSEPVQDPEAETPMVYDVMMPDGTKLGEAAGMTGWDSVTETDLTQLQTEKTFSRCYSVTKDTDKYVIGIDKFGNYTIFGGVYGYVRLKVGEDYGECYILSGEDHSELEQMISYFGASSSAVVPSSDTGLDYIQLELATGRPDSRTVTVSADGFCLTDNNSGEQAANKYFTKLDKESFVSLVQWVDQVLSQEYE